MGSSFVLRDGSTPPTTLTSPTTMRPALRQVVNNIPALVRAFQRYSALYATVKPALLAPGGLGATLRAAPALGANMDKWMLENDVALLIPLAGQLLMQTGYGHLYETSAASALQYLSPFVLVRGALLFVVCVHRCCLWLMCACACLCVQCSGLGGSGIDTSRLLTADDTMGYNSSLYMLTVRA